MSRFAAKTWVSRALIAVTALTGVIPAIGYCETGTESCRAKECSCGCCCGSPATTSHSCCTPKATVRTCSCSDGPQRPVTPQQRPSTNEREDVRLAQTLPSMCVIFDDGRSVPTSNEADLLTPLPAGPQQAVLCRWLV